MFELDAERRLLALSRELLAGQYRHAPYTVLEIRDPKPRLIAVATLRDRVLHRAVYDALAPSFERSFTTDTFACLSGRGSHRAVLRLLELLRRHHHVLHLDVARFFPSVNQETLLGLLVPRLRDPRVHVLIREILRSGRELYLRPDVAAFYGTDREWLQQFPAGLPIGNVTSQWWGNLILSGLDHFVKRRLKIPGYVRYLDDMVLFADEPARLREAKAVIAAWLWTERRLWLNPRKGHVRAATLPHLFLGYRVTRAGVDLGPKAARRFRRAVREAAGGSELDLERRLVSWRGAAAF